MRVGLIAPPWLEVPPEAYGGTEAVVDDLARALDARGHEVHLFTVGTSRCPVDRHHLFATPAQPMGYGLHEAAHVLAAYDSMAALRVDVVHDHTGLGALIGGATSGRAATSAPIVTTHHGAFDGDSRLILPVAAQRALIVAISRSHAASAAPIPVDAVVLHGIDLDAFRPGGAGRGYLVFIGRMAEEKGVHRAVAIARRAGRPLRIIAKMREPEEHEYFERRVAPLLTADDPPPEELSLPDRLAVLQGADALLNPISWAEPFGLVMAEALACGVPVITSPLGAAPEIVEHGRTGFLAHDIDEMVTAVRRLPLIDRAACRRAAEKRFGRDRMARDYEAVYARAITRGVRPPGRYGRPIALAGQTG